MDKIGRFLGRWKFLPQKSKYSSGGPPLSCTYTISTHPFNKNGLQFNIEWIDKESKFQNIQYQVDLNGQPHPQKFYGIDVDVVTTFQKQGVLQILKSVTTLKNKALLSQGIRKIGEDPNKLIVEMNNYKGDEKVEIYQEYQRIDS